MSRLLSMSTAIAILISSNTVFGQEKTIRVSGHVQFDEPMAKMQIIKREGSEKIVVAEFDLDSQNNYSYELKVKEPGLYTLDCKRWEQISFWAEDEDVQINFRGQDTAKMKIKNPKFYMIKGGPKNEVINHINFIMHRNYQGINSCFTADLQGINLPLTVQKRL